MLAIVPTPIGNTLDITIRAIDVLKNSDTIYCENKKYSTRLMRYFNINTSLKLYNEYSDNKIRIKIVKQLKEGKYISLISNAGMPIISDPGYKLIKECQLKKIKYTILPGASSVLTALVTSGIKPNKFIFGGFLPTKSIKRKKILKDFLKVPATKIFFETPHRIVSTLKDIYIIMGNCQITICRELSKAHEECKKEYVLYMIKWYNKKKPKGEMVIIIG